MENEQKSSGGGRKPWAAYNVIERKDNGKKIWSRVGSAFKCQDGSFNLILDSFPLGGKVNIREDDRDRRFDEREP
jgi:hypothetical protein